MEIREINKKEAESFFARYEHLGNCGLGVWHYGLLNNEAIMSVVSFGATNFDPNRSKLGALAQQHDLRVIQLTRGGTAFDAPKNIPSYTISLALKEVQKRFGDNIVVAYSDTKWNEIGTIYQASNFLYLGLTYPKGQSNYQIDGRLYSGWTIRKKYGTRDMKKLVEITDAVTRIPLTQKHIYIYLNMPKRKKRIILRELQNDLNPFPKREYLNVGSMLEIRKNLRSVEALVLKPEDHILFINEEIEMCHNRLKEYAYQT